MYFKRFPKIFYTVDIAGKPVLTQLMDITTNVRFRKEVLQNITLYDFYDIQEGETPEIVADKAYGNSQYHWIVMIFNDRFDYIEDWPLPLGTLNQLIEEKYGATGQWETHHWEDENGYTVLPNVYGAVPISNYEYETRLNDGKRRIRLIAPELLGSIIDQFRGLI